MTVAILWLWFVEGHAPSRWDLIGAGVSILGMAIIVVGQSERP